MAEGELQRLIGRFRRQLLQKERAAASVMVREYGGIWRRIQGEIRRLVAQYKALEEADPAWLYQFERLQTLQRQVLAEMRLYQAMVEASITGQQMDAVLTAQEHAELLMRAGMGTPPPGVTLGFNRLPRGALIHLVGALQDGTPLRRLLEELGSEAAKIVADGLVQGLALGQGAREIERYIRRGLGGNMARSLRIARTEVIRAYRETTHQTFRENDDLVKGWIWRSARNERTCAACWAMDGTVHALDERLDDHPNGRCFEEPVMKTWRELGFEIDGPERVKESGEEAFEKLSEAQKLKILGPAKYAAYREGAIRLRDLVGRRRSAIWGTMRYERSLRELLGSKAEQYYLSTKKILGFSFYQAGDMPPIDVAMAFKIGNGPDGWAAGERIFRTYYLPKYGVIDDLERTLGLWGTPEPSFNAWLGGRRENIIGLAKEWGQNYQQEAMAILLPTKTGQGGVLSWRFDRPLTNGELDRLLGGIVAVNKELEQMKDVPLGMIGLTVRGRQQVEFWVSRENEQDFGRYMVEKAMIISKLEIPDIKWKGGYEFVLLWRGTDY